MESHELLNPPNTAEQPTSHLRFSEAEPPINYPESPMYTGVAASRSSSKSHKRSRGYSVLDYWRKEAASYMLAFLALAAIISILITSDNKPVQHRSGPFTTNSLVSIFTAILKSAMSMPIAEGLGELKWLWFNDAQSVTDIDHFDLASRGPRGSLQFLFRLPNNKLASMGAFIIILALGIDPFTQQVIQDGDCPWPMVGLATISRTNNYTAYGYRDKMVMPVPMFKPDSQMSLAMYIGMLDPPTNSTSSNFYSCPSGFCEFPSDSFSYSSLEMCAAVENITLDIMEFSDWGSGYRLPSGLEIRQPLGSTTCSIGTTNRSGAGENEPYFELEILMFEATRRRDKSPVYFTDLSPHAYRASLFPCIQKYQNVTISEGRLSQTLIATTRLLMINTTSMYYSIAGDFPAFPGVDCVPVAAPLGSKTQATHRLISGKDFIVPDLSSDDYKNPSVHLTASQGTLWYDPACTYEFGPEPTVTIDTALRNSFGVIGRSEDTNTSTALMLHGASVEDDGGIQIETSDPWIDQLYQTGFANLTTITTYMQGISDSITARMRIAGDVTNSLPLNGHAMTMRRCTRVKWAWLSLDLVLMLSTAIFFILTTYRARQVVKPGPDLVCRGSWKSSSLPLLWCGLEDSSRENNESADEVEKMEEKSDLLEVKLVKLPGWVTVESEVPSEPGELEDSYATSRATGRWVLQEQRQLTTAGTQPRLREWGIKWGKQVPI